MKKVFLLSLMLLFGNILFAEDNILDGFDDEEENKVIKIKKDNIMKEENDIKIIEFDGDIKFSTIFNLNHRDPNNRFFSQLQFKLTPGIKLNINEDWFAYVSGSAFNDFIYSLKGREGLSQEYLGLYENELELRDAYLQGTMLSFLDVKIGRQIVIWGNADSVRVVDILNPLDIRQPGMIDIEDMRLPVFMSRVDLNFSKVNLTLLIIHEPRFNKMPVLGSDFFPSTIALPKEIIPVVSIKNTEYGAAVNFHFSALDFSFHYARVFNDEAYLKQISITEINRLHSIVHMGGGCIGMVLGSLLLKTEIAYLYGFQFMSQGNNHKGRLDAMAGFDFNGIADTVLSLEFVNQHLFEFQELMETIDGAKENIFQWVFRTKIDLLYKTIHLLGMASIRGISGEGGGFSRIEVGYDIIDNLAITFGTVFYYSGNYKLFKKINDYQRMFLELKYSY